MSNFHNPFKTTDMEETTQASIMSSQAPLLDPSGKAMEIV